MELGVGLPNGVPGTTRDDLLTWARDAEAASFDVLGAIDRFGWEAVEPMAALAAAGAVTDRIRLAPTVLAVPLRDRATVAEQVTSLDRLAPGRLTLGVGLGGRPDDYADSAFAWTRRGRRMDEVLAWLTDNGRLGGTPVVVGGHSPAAFERVGRWADGYVSAGGPTKVVDKQFRRAEDAWNKHGRDGAPKRWATAYVALDGQAEAGRDFLRVFYATTGSYADLMVDGLLTDRDGVRRTVEAYRDVGCDVLVFLPTVCAPSQVAALADALGLVGDA